MYGVTDKFSKTIWDISYMAYTQNSRKFDKLYGLYKLIQYI